MQSRTGRLLLEGKLLRASNSGRIRSQSEACDFLAMRVHRHALFLDIPKSFQRRPCDRRAWCTPEGGKFSKFESVHKGVSDRLVRRRLPAGGASLQIRSGAEDHTSGRATGVDTRTVVRNGDRELYRDRLVMFCEHAWEGWRVTLLRFRMRSVFFVSKGDILFVSNAICFLCFRMRSVSFVAECDVFSPVICAVGITGVGRPFMYVLSASTEAEACAKALLLSTAGGLAGRSYVSALVAMWRFVEASGTCACLVVSPPRHRGWERRPFLLGLEMGMLRGSERLTAEYQNAHIGGKSRLFTRALIRKRTTRTREEVF